jgi:hypothetical protein
MLLVLPGRLDSAFTSDHLATDPSSTASPSLLAEWIEFLDTCCREVVHLAYGDKTSVQLTVLQDSTSMVPPLI